MKHPRGSARGRARLRERERAGDAGARARVDDLFERVDLLTPDELARIGVVRRDPNERRRLWAEVEAIARRSNRGPLLEAVVGTARERLLVRIGSGTFNPTWVTLNWGLSGGTTESRAAIVMAVEDAAAAAVVADVADPGLVDALSLDAERITAMSTGSASDGAFSRGVAAPPSSEYRSSRARWIAIVFAAASIGGLLAFLVGAVLGEESQVTAFVASTFLVWLLLARALRPAHVTGNGSRLS